MFVIEAPGVSSANRYIQSVKLNGRSVGGMTLRHDVITSGGDVVFTMGPKPKGPARSRASLLGIRAEKENYRGAIFHEIGEVVR